MTHFIAYLQIEEIEMSIDRKISLLIHGVYGISNTVGVS